MAYDGSNAYGRGSPLLPDPFESLANLFSVPPRFPMFTKKLGLKPRPSRAALCYAARSGRVVNRSICASGP